MYSRESTVLIRRGSDAGADETLASVQALDV
jgi:hypothetical protein